MGTVDGWIDGVGPKRKREIEKERKVGGWLDGNSKKWKRVATETGWREFPQTRQTLEAFLFTLSCLEFFFLTKGLVITCELSLLCNILCLSSVLIRIWIIFLVADYILIVYLVNLKD